MNKAFLIILDGFGHSEKKEHNAVALANSPYIDKLFKDYPNSLIKTDGDAVGLPEGVMGNSEVGHLTIGSGRVSYQDLSKISKYSETTGFGNHPMIKSFTNHKGAIHLCGLISDGGVHSHIDHLVDMINSLLNTTSSEIVVHMISDGRDTSPTSGIEFAKKLQSKFSNEKRLKLASVVGRFYAMDRDKRWERVELAYNLLANGTSEHSKFSNLEEAISHSYDENIMDEFIKPRLTKDFKAIEEGDKVVFFNFRSDRAREISIAFCEENFEEFKRAHIHSKNDWYTFTKYREDFKFPVLFEKEIPKNILGEIVSKSGGKQLRAAETEKYAHVTFFLNGGREDSFENEDRILVDSPKDIETYDLKPEMSAPELTEELLNAVETKDYDLIVVNYANGDMVGHTGVEEAAIKAVECLDKCLSKLVPKALDAKYEIIITADHGNCEEMLNEATGKAFTQHSMNRVPLIWVGEKAKMGSVKNGGLSDLAPSILKLMGIDKPVEMSGSTLLGWEK